MRSPATLSVCLATLCGALAHGAVITQVDTFSSGFKDSWGASSQELTVPADGGPAGAGDRYLQYQSTGTFGPNSRLVIPNEIESSPWRGDYNAIGAVGIQLDVRNLGDRTLNLRLAVTDGVTWFASSDPIVVPSMSPWTSVAFSLTDAAMTRLGSGAGTLAGVLGNVTSLRILSTTALPILSFGGTGSPQGDTITATIGLDNIRFVAIPEPTGVTLAATAALVAARRRRQA